MSKTVDDLIRELQELKPVLRKLPVKVLGKNGLEFEADIRPQVRWHPDGKIDFTAVFIHH